MKRYIRIAILIFLGQEVVAQSSLDLFTYSFRYGFPQTAGEPVSGTNTEFAGLLNIKIPVVISKKTIWYNDFTYVYSNVKSNANLDSDIANPLKISGFIFQTGLVQSLNNHQKIQLIVAPRFMTDFEYVTSANWQFGGTVLFENTFSDNLIMRFGFMFNQEQFGPSLTPLVYLDWQISSKWSVKGLVPLYLKVSYQVSENFTAGFSHFALITSYRLGHPNYKDDYIERSSIDLTLFARQKIWHNLYVEGRVGFAVDRKYMQYAKDQKMDLKVALINFGDDRIPQNRLMKTGPIAILRLVYNLPLD